LGCLDNVACLVHKVLKEVVETQDYQVQKEMLESKEKEDNRV